MILQPQELNYCILNQTNPPNATAYPKIWTLVIDDPRINQLPVTNPISLITPARVRTSPEAAPISQTDERFRANVRQALWNERMRSVSTIA